MRQCHNIFELFAFHLHFAHFLPLLCIFPIVRTAKTKFFQIFSKEYSKSRTLYFYFFVEFSLTFPLSLSKIVYGKVYAEAVWAVTRFMITGNSRGLRDKSVLGFSHSAPTGVKFAFFLPQRQFANKTVSAIFRGHPFSFCPF